MSRHRNEVGSGGVRISSGADQPALAHHVAPVAQVGVGVARAVARDLAALDVLVEVAAEDVAVAREGDAAAVGHDLQAVARQIERR